MDLRTILFAFQSIGLGGMLRALQYSRYRDRLERSSAQVLSSVAHSPGMLHSPVTVTDGTATFRFERTSLEITFLSADLVRLAWDNAPLPLPYALARADWPSLTPTIREEAEGYALSTSELTLLVRPDAGVDFLQRGNLLCRQAPPEFEGAASTQRVTLRPDEHLFGLGEQPAPFDRRAPSGQRSYRLWNSDPGGNYGRGTDPIYLNLPVYLSLHPGGSYLAFYENAFEALVTLDGQLTTCFSGGQLRSYFIPGPPARAIERFTELTGRPPLPPRWALGYHQSRWGYKTEADVRRVADGFLRHDLPLSAIHLDLDHTDGKRIFTFHRKRFPRPEALARDLAANGVRLVTIIDPGVKRDPHYDLYAEGAAQDVFLHQPDGKPFFGAVWPGWTAFPDFTNPLTREWWGKHYRCLLDRGVAGFWHDMNEPASFAAYGDGTLPRSLPHHFDGRGGSHAEAHNLYALLMNRAGYEGLRRLRPDTRPWIVSRSGWVGLQRYAWTWTADIESTWDALHLTISQALSLGMCGIPYTGPDIGGFSGDPSAELYVRWLQTAALLPFCRTHSALNTSEREPWVFGEPYTSIVRQALRLRYRLLPYLYTLSWEAAQTGYPLIRPIWWQDWENDTLWGVDDSFLLGDALLVAPVIQEGGLSRGVILPSGDWYHFWDDALYPAGPVEVAAPLDRIPLFVRAGSIVPMEIGDRLEIHLYPTTQSTARGRLYCDAGDGYGPHRVAHFDLNGSTLTGQSEGEYPFPYAGVSVVRHGPHAARLETGFFQEIQIG